MEAPGGTPPPGPDVKIGAPPAPDVSPTAAEAAAPVVPAASETGQPAATTAPEGLKSDALEGGVAGFDMPRSPQDELVAGHYKEAGLPEAPSMADLEPKALELLGDPNTVLKGMEMVLGRSISSDEIKKNSALLTAMMPVLPAGDRFAILLMQKAIDLQNADKSKE